jgi:hypothetical protein
MNYMYYKLVLVIPSATVCDTTYGLVSQIYGSLDPLVNWLKPRMSDISAYPPLQGLNWRASCQTPQ